jgi:hypothetical protein
VTTTDERAHVLAEKLVVFLEMGTPPEGLFSPDVFCDFTLPLWRLQATGIEGVVALRKAGHPGPGRVPRWRFDPTPHGFVLEFEEDWQQDGQRWTSREMARVDVADDGISQLSVYCTGDWDDDRRAAHAQQVTLIRP